jgi:hypothetical protein
LQEKIAAAWEQRNAPIEAAVVVDPAEAVVAEAVVADAVPLDAVIAEAVEALPAEGGIYDQGRFTVLVTPLSARSDPAESVVAAEPVVAAEVVEGEPIPAAVALEGIVVENFIEAEPVESEPVFVPPVDDAPGSVGGAPPSVPGVVGDAHPTMRDVPTSREGEVVVPPPGPRIEAPPPLPDPEPEPVFVPPELEHAPVAETPVAEPPAAPTPDPLPSEPVAEIFTLDAAADRPAPMPVGPLTVFGGEKTVTEAVGDILSLDAAASPPAAPVPAPAVPKSSPPAPQPVSADEIFSLDADALSGRSQPAGADLFSLDADAIPTAAAFMQPTPRPAGPGAIPGPAMKGADSGVTASAETPAAPAAKERVTITKAAGNGRPAIKITLVRPGEKSPLQ